LKRRDLLKTAAVAAPTNFSAEEKAKLFSGTAKRVYRL
jgi:predicted TIM-barrel fold metal-dependent hydrolase